MPVAPELLSRARRLNPSAAAEVIAEHYPAVYRIARGLCGSEPAAKRVVQFLTARAVPMLPRWREERDPDRWFYHHAVLASRRFAPGGRSIYPAGRGAGKPPKSAKAGSALPPPNQDLLALAGGPAPASADPTDESGAIPPAYIAFIRALRNLPSQQREAFILHHGEHLNPRYLGVAMDCSMLAAEAHLQAADQSLASIVGSAFPDLLAHFIQAYNNLTPPEDAGLRPALRRRVAAYVWPRRALRWIRWLLLFTVLAAAAYYVYTYKQQLDQYLPKS